MAEQVLTVVNDDDLEPISFENNNRSSTATVMESIDGMLDHFLVQDNEAPFCVGDNALSKTTTTKKLQNEQQLWDSLWTSSSLSSSCFASSYPSLQYPLSIKDLTPIKTFKEGQSGKSAISNISSIDTALKPTKPSMFSHFSALKDNLVNPGSETHMDDVDTTDSNFMSHLMNAGGGATTVPVISSSSDGNSTLTTNLKDEENGGEGDDDDMYDQDSYRFRSYQSQGWYERLQELADYKKQHGHCLVPHNWDGNRRLAQWVKRQRYQFKLYCAPDEEQNKRSTLSPKRINILNSLGFVWDSHKVTWEEKFQQLKQFYEENGHCNIGTTKSSNVQSKLHKQLAIWIRCQRRQRKLYDKGGGVVATCTEKRKDGCTMTQEKICKLNQIHFDWKPRKSK